MFTIFGIFLVVAFVALAPVLGTKERINWSPVLFIVVVGVFLMFTWQSWGPAASALIAK